MRLIQPTTIGEAVAALCAEPDARCLAGGATLVAMMNAELVEPELLVSLDRIPELVGIEAGEGGSVRIAAMTRHATVAVSGAFADGQRIMPLAAACIGHPAIRNMGTIGGSICHADPSADYPTAMVCADALIEIATADGTRRVAAREFFRDWFETALEPGELVTAVHVPAAPPDSRARYLKYSRADGDFATVSVAMMIAVEGGRVTHFAAAIGGCGPTPVRSNEAEALLTGQAPDEAPIGEAGRLIAEACDPVDDARGSAAYRLRLVPRLFRRTFEELTEK